MKFVNRGLLGPLGGAVGVPCCPGSVGAAFPGGTHRGGCFLSWPGNVHLETEPGSSPRAVLWAQGAAELGEHSRRAWGPVPGQVRQVPPTCLLRCHCSPRGPRAACPPPPLPPAWGICSSSQVPSWLSMPLAAYRKVQSLTHLPALPLRASLCRRKAACSPRTVQRGTVVSLCNS